jgi:hypothetical protein
VCSFPDALPIPRRSSVYLFVPVCSFVSHGSGPAEAATMLHQYFVPNLRNVARSHQRGRFWSMERRG